MKLSRRAGATSQIWQIFIQDSSSTTGAGLTGLTSASGSLTAYYHRDTDTTATAISLVTMTAGTFTSSGFIEIDATHMPGVYAFCPPNTALASGAASCVFMLKGATNMAPLPIEVDLDSQVDVYLWNGTAVAAPATAGIPDVNAKNINNVATTSVTTINANQGTTQPVNFTGTAGSALVKSDSIDIGSTAQTGRDLGASVLLSSGTGTGQVLLSSGTVTVGTNNDKTGYSLISSGLNLVLVDGKTLPAALQYIAASAAGQVSGAGTGTEVFLGLDGSTTRLTISADASGNRTAIVYG